MTRPVRTLLLIEDFAPDRELYRRSLLSDTTAAYRLLEADSVKLGLEMCRTETIDAILLDYLLPDADGLQFLESLQVQSNGSIPPVVIVTGEGDEAIAVQAMKLGVEDYLIKCRLTPEMLQMAIRSAIENSKLQRQLQEANQQMTTIWESMTDAYVTLDQEWRIVYANRVAIQVIRQVTKLAPEAFLGKTHWEVFPWSVGQIIEREYRRAVAEQVAVHFECVYELSGSWFEVHAYPSAAGLGIYFRDISNRKRLEADREQAKVERDRFFNLSTDLLMIGTLNGSFLQVNPAWTNTLGWSQEELTARAYLEFVHPDDLAATRKEAENLVQGGALTNFENRYLCRDGSYRWLSWNVAVAKDNLMYGVARDVTDRNRNEQRLRESEERLRLGVQVAEVALARFDYASNQVELSPEAALLYGLPDEHVVSRDRIHATFHPDEREMMEQIISQVLDPDGDGWFARDHRVVWQTGEVRWLSVRKQVFFDRSGATPRPNYAILAAIDITDRKQAEVDREQMQEALRQSEEQLRFVADTIPHIVWVTDAYGVTRYVNQRWSEYTGLTLEEALDYDWQNLLHPDDLHPVRAFWTETCQTASLYEIEYRLRRADGMFRWQLAKGRPMRNEQGQVLSWFGTCTDIHEQKQAELDRDRLLIETQTAREEAEAANRSKDEFVAMVAHELRSPLNSIAGWSKLLQVRKFDEVTLTKALDAIYRNTQTQVQLVEDLLDISRMVRGTLQINSTPLRLVDVIHESLETVRPAAEAKQIQLETQLNDTSQILGDVNRLQQIVVNLLTNAIKFTSGSGRVEVSLIQVQDQVELQIRDTGKGIAAEILPFIFERFQQGQQNTGSKDGLGLGLAIVKNLVELHQGTISAESPGVGQGATFTVRFPVLKATSLDRTTDSKNGLVMNQTTLAGIRIFVVDDEPDMVDLITFVLEEYGAEVKSASSAAATLEQLPKFKPDILISDIAMPDGNGYELVQQMRVRPGGNIPAIALTAYSSATYEERSLQAGFERHLTKPVETKDLIAAITHFVKLTHPRA